VSKADACCLQATGADSYQNHGMAYLTNDLMAGADGQHGPAPQAMAAYTAGPDPQQVRAAPEGYLGGSLSVIQRGAD
jgi:hypothetical protein